MANPGCIYFGHCGGCSLQHIDYDIQLKNKRNFLANAAGYDDIKVFSGKEYNYRNRMDFIFHKKGLGLRNKAGNIMDIERCEIADEKINVLLKELREFFKDNDCFDMKKGTLISAVIRTPKNCTSVCFELNQNSSKIADAVEKIKKFSENTSADNVLITYGDNFFAVKGNEFLEEDIMGKTFIYSALGFFQNNSEMAEKMHGYVNDILKKYETKDSVLLDLYAGVGTFGIINSDLFREAVIIENDRNCINAAEINIKENKANARAICSEAEYLKKAKISGKLFVVADPPRSGMHQKTIVALRELKPEVIIYVSCNPSQLGKDIKKFREYEIKSMALFDLFPQTNHSESVAELKRK